MDDIKKIDKLQTKMDDIKCHENRIHTIKHNTLKTYFPQAHTSEH